MYLRTAILAVFAATAIAAPLALPQAPDGTFPTNCLSESDADQVATVFKELIESYTDQLALDALTVDFTDYSSSVNFLLDSGTGKPKVLTTATTTSRAEFMKLQDGQPSIPFTKLNTWNSCNAVTLRWLTTDSAHGQPHKAESLPAVGNVVIETVKSSSGDKYPFRIKEWYSEFNSGAWAVNAGLLVPAKSS